LDHDARVGIDRALRSITDYIVSLLGSVPCILRTYEKLLRVVFPVGQAGKQMLSSFRPHRLHASALNHPATLFVRFNPLLDLPSTFITWIKLDE